MMQKQTTKNVLVLASGNGSNFEAIVKYFKKHAEFSPVDFTLLSDNKNSGALKKAQELAVPAFYVPFKDTYDFLKNQVHFDLHVLAGYMRILPPEILKDRNFINIHPSLLPLYKGKNAIEQAFYAKDSKTGVTIHHVCEKVDEGKIIAQREILISENMTLCELEKAVHDAEHKLYPSVVRKLLFNKLNVLLIGSGARENALASKIKESKFLNKLYLADPNDGFKNLGQVIEYENFTDLASIACNFDVDLLVVGPEKPLAEGIVDVFKNYGIDSIGPSEYWAQLETSKAFAKSFMEKNAIKTAKYKVVSNIENIEKALSAFSGVPVLKADGLARGRGVLLCETHNEAKESAKEFLNGKYGEASKKIIFEEKLYGIETSLISLWDGNTLCHFPPAKDYKKLSNGDIGPNTGGMGSFCPLLLSFTQEKELENYKKKLQDALKNSTADFKGIIYSGLIFTENGLCVLEYNMRFGDPEIQSLSELMDFDLLEVFCLMAKGELDRAKIKFKNEKAYCVVVAANGYPHNPIKGGTIGNIKNVIEKYGVTIYYAGVKGIGDTEGAMGCLSADGGRILNVVKSGPEALSDIYKAVDEIEFKDKLIRHDIGC